MVYRESGWQLDLSRVPNLLLLSLMMGSGSTMMRRQAMRLVSRISSGKLVGIKRNHDQVCPL